MKTNQIDRNDFSGFVGRIVLASANEKDNHKQLICEVRPIINDMNYVIIDKDGSRYQYSLFGMAVEKYNQL